MANPASALGEAVGKIVEKEIQAIVRDVVAPFGLFVDTGGKRKGKRKGKKLLLINETGNSYQLDTVVEDKDGNPLILIESKYLRYKKHNRDKGSWTCVAHYKLRTTYPTVKKSIAILMGNWSKPSKELMKSFGVETLEIPFKELVNVLHKHGIEFDWAEKDSKTPKKSWAKFQRLPALTKRFIAQECLAPHKESLERMVLEAVLANAQKPKNVDRIEVLIKTTHNEFYVKHFRTIKDSLKYIIGLVVDPKDLKDLLK